MIRFNYKARDSEGKMLRGEVDAEDRQKAAGHIINLGATPVTIQETTEKSVMAGGDIQQLLGKYFQKAIPLSDLIVFARHFKALMHAGVPIIRGIRGLADNTEEPKLSGALSEVAGDLESGGALAEGMNKHNGVFPPLFVHMVRVGEQSGQLEMALGQMADNLEQERLTRSRVKSAMRYPTFVLVAIAVAMVVVNIFVIPTFADLFESLDAELPLATRILLGTSEFFLAYWLYMLIAAGGVYYGVRSYMRSDAGRYQWDRLKLRIPIIGGVLKRALLSRFSRTFAMALRAGVPLLTAIDTVADSTDNAYISRGIRELRTGIERGESLYSVCEQSGLFTPMVLQMLAVGEETGQLADLMDQVADFYESQVDEDLDRLPSYIEPIMIGMIGIMVFVLALGIFMPIWNMSSAF